MSAKVEVQKQSIQDIKYILVGTQRSGKEIVGYAIREVASGVTSVLTIPQTMELVSKFGVSGLVAKDNKLVGSNGSVDRYSSRDEYGQLIGDKQAIVVVGKIYDEKNGHVFYCADIFGYSATFTMEQLIGFLDNPVNSLANGKIVTREGHKIVSAISGEYPEIPVPATEKKTKHRKTRPEIEAEINAAPTQEEKDKITLKYIMQTKSIVARFLMKHGHIIKSDVAFANAIVQNGAYYPPDIYEEEKLKAVAKSVIESFNKKEGFKY